MGALHSHDPESGDRIYVIVRCTEYTVAFRQQCYVTLLSEIMKDCTRSDVVSSPANLPYNT